jgi:hypothetical protein
MDITKNAVWVLGVKAVLMSMYKMPEEKARGIIGKWGRDYPPETVLEALIALVKNEPIDPIPYMATCLKAAPKPVKQEEPTGQWAMRVKAWENKQMWPLMWGPQPGEEGCQCPPQYLIGN